MNLPFRLTKETLAMLMIGDGVLAMLQPRRHVNLWRGMGPQSWREALSFMDRRPGLTAALGALEAGLGLWLAARQRPAPTMARSRLRGPVSRLLH